MSKKELLKWKNKYKLWDILHPTEIKCLYCKFNDIECYNKMKYWGNVMGKWGYCMEFLKPGNYIKHV